MARIKARKFVIFTVVALLFTIGMIVHVEWNYGGVVKLEQDQIVDPRVNERLPKVINENHDEGPPRRLEQDIQLRTPPPLPDRNLKPNNIYAMLKTRKQHELRLEKNIQEMWWYIRKQLKKMDSLNVQQYLNRTSKNVQHRFNSLWWTLGQLNTVYSDSEPFQLNWKFWQKNTSAELVSLMDARLKYLQNPADCKSAKKLVCYIAKACGFGCQMHHVSYCFIMAYATKRTLILDSSNWKYSPRGWSAIFQPVSSTCTEMPSGKQVRKKVLHV